MMKADLQVNAVIVFSGLVIKIFVNIFGVLNF